MVPLLPAALRPTQVMEGNYPVVLQLCLDTDAVLRPVRLMDLLLSAVLVSAYRRHPLFSPRSCALTCRLTHQEQQRGPVATENECYLERYVLDQGLRMPTAPRPSLRSHISSTKSLLTAPLPLPRLNMAARHSISLFPECLRGLLYDPAVAVGSASGSPPFPSQGVSVDGCTRRCCIC
jgi:hypothetical protein